MPVVGGIVVIALIGLATWAMAAFISSGNAETSERLAPSTLVLGNVENFAASIDRDGPLLIPGLNTKVGERSIVVDHTGSVAADNWRVYWAYPADKDASCPVEQVRGTADFIDCDGRTIDVTELSPPDAGVNPRVTDRTTLEISLRGVTEDAGDTVTGG